MITLAVIHIVGATHKLKIILKLFVVELEAKVHENSVEIDESSK